MIQKCLFCEKPIDYDPDFGYQLCNRCGYKLNMVFGIPLQDVEEKLQEYEIRKRLEKTK